MVRRIVFLFLGAMAFLNAQAGAQMFLEEAKVSLNVTGGEHRNGSLLLHNTSADPMTVRVYWEDFEYLPPYDGTKKFAPAGTMPGSASQWVAFSPATFTLPAFGQQRVDYTVTVPPQINEGHYGVLFFERNAGEQQMKGDTVVVVTRIGCLFFVEPAKKDKNASIQDIQRGASGITANFVNQGKVILIPNTTYYIMDDAGLATVRGECRKCYVPPGASGPLEVPIKDKLKPGHYTLVINSDLEEGDVVVKEIGLAVDESGQITIVSSKD